MERQVITKRNIELLDKFNWKHFALDTETTDLKQSALELTGVSIYDGTYNYYIPTLPSSEIYVTPDTIVSRLISEVTKDSKVVYWNFVFDARVLAKYGFDAGGSKYFDAMIAYHLIDENDRKSLKHCTRTILGREVEDFDINLSHYCQEFFDYALDDSLNTWDLYKIFLPELEKQNLMNLFFKIEMPFQLVLLEMAITGVDIDIDLLADYQLTLTDEVLKLESQLYEILDEPYSMQFDIFGKPLSVVGDINFNSNKQLAHVMFNRLGLEIVEHTPTGQPKTGKVTIEKYKKDNEFVEALYKYKIASKLLNGFISGDGQIQKNLESDGKVRPNFKDIGTKTGRLSCTQPNLQQLPKPKEYSPVRVRDLFIAPAGYKMFSCDYSSQEICVAAQISKDPTLVEALSKGWDSHLAVANNSYNLGLSPEALFDGSPEHKIARKKYGSERGKAKTINFGLMYGKGAYGFAKDFGIPEEEAQVIVDDYFKGMPKLKESIEATHKEIEETGVIKSLAGRIRHFNIPKTDNFALLERAKRQSFNFKVQGFSADMIRAASINVYRRNKVPAWGLKAVMTVHDEVVYIVKDEYVKEATSMVKSAFEDAGKKFVVPIKADIEVGTNYGNAK